VVDPTETAVTDVAQLGDVMSDPVSPLTSVTATQSNSPAV